jgi:hypothetical protein
MHSANAMPGFFRLAAISGLVCLAGCLERRVHVESDPPGALVTINDVEIGRTPVEADFTYYGEYDVRLDLDGYEPLRTRARADTPIYEYPPFDLVATAMPAKIENVVRWHFKLEKALEDRQSPEEFEKNLLERANTVRQQMRGSNPTK